jgi:Ca-activated chloride channel family protein
MALCGPMASLFQRKFARNLTLDRQLHLNRTEKLLKIMRTGRAQFFVNHIGDQCFGLFRPPFAARTLWCVLLLFASLAYAQSPNKKDTDTQHSPKAADDPNTFKVNVRLVNVFTSVTDAHGSPVGDLTKDDFKVLEDGVPQAISVFDKESDLPLNIVLAVDTSESTRRDMKLETVSAKRFVRSIMRPIDHLSLFQITENVDQLTGFTSDPRIIERGIDRLQAGAGTAVFDTIFLAADSLIDRKGRKVLVLITDGGDTTSKTDYNNALRRAVQAEALIYSIIIVPVAADAGRNLGGEHALIQMSKDTGGKYYYAEGITSLDEAFRKISEELRTQYLIGYYPNRRVSDSPFRRIQVEVAKKDGSAETFQVRHRAGYYTAPAR